MAEPRQKFTSATGWGTGRTWTRSILDLDRRIIYLLVFLLVFIPLLQPLELPVTVTEEVRRAYALVESLDEGEAILISIDFGPSTAPECLPVYRSLLHQCFQKGLRPIIISLVPDGRGIAQRGLSEVLAFEGPGGGRLYADLVYGRDYAFLGYKAGGSAVMIGVGQSFATTFPSDYQRRPLGELPMFNEFRKLGDCSAIFDIAAVGYPEYWVSYGSERYGVPLAVSCTAVSAAQYYPYYVAGQFTGLVNGMKGAAEYEKLADAQYSGTTGRLLGSATKGMDAQTGVHLFIVMAIILANVALFAERRRRSGGQA